MTVEIKHYQMETILIIIIRSYFKDIKNDLKKCDAWKIRLTVAIIFISEQLDEDEDEDDNDEERLMNSKSDNIDIEELL